MKSHSNDNEMVHEEPVVDIPLEDPVVEDDDVETPKVEQSDDGESPSKRPNHVAAWIWARDFFLAYDFPILILVFIGVAKAAPEVGATYVAPDITAYWIAVALIFFLSGVSLQTEQCTYAMTRYRFNAYVMLYNFGFVSAVVFGVARGLKSAGVLSSYYSDGLVACGALPLAVNAVSILTGACHGDEAVAIFNEAISNMIGVFLSPLLIRGYLGKTSNADLPTIFWKLILRVLVPLVIGQMLRYLSTAVIEFRKRNDFWFGRAQKYLLVFVEYTIFCTTFKKHLGSGIGDALILVLVVFILQAFFLSLAWIISYYFYRDQPRLRIVGLFGPAAKTTSLGIPLILSLYQGNPRATIYTLPVLIWHPMLLIVGSIMTPCLRNWVDREVERVEGKTIDGDEIGDVSEDCDEEAAEDDCDEEVIKDTNG